MQHRNSATGSMRRTHSLGAPAWIVAMAAALGLVLPLASAQEASPGLRDATGEYHFLGPQDTLAILEEEGKLRGYIDVFQGANESDAILSYSIIAGSREGNRIEFRTRKVHEKYYRFAGTAEKGSGHKRADGDYLRLAGDLETITVNGATGQERVEHQNVVFKSKSASEIKNDAD